jgi:hypothetical protein
MSENLARTEYPDIEGDEEYDPDWERLCSRKMGFNHNHGDCDFSESSDSDEEGTRDSDEMLK